MQRSMSCERVRNRGLWMLLSGWLCVSGQASARLVVPNGSWPHCRLYLCGDGERSSLVAAMSRRLTSLLVSLSLILLVVFVDVVVQLLTSDISHLPSVLQIARRWSLPLLGVTVLLLVAGTVWQYLAEHPLPVTSTWVGQRPPYPGLEAFIEQDAGVFFGREPQIVELLDRLHPMLADRAHRFVAVIGPSGVGKSSLVQAGLLPRLARQRSRWVVVPPLVPGAQPMRSLARSLAVVLPDTDVNVLTAQLAADPATLGRCVERLRAGHGGRAASVLVVIDQVEELLTLTGEQERLAFLTLLDTALQEDPRLWVVATLRSEFLNGFLTTDFASLFSKPVAIGSLDRAALFEVIEEPAVQAGLTFAPGVVNELVDDTGGGDALPLLAYTLQGLYLKVGSGGTVTLEAYRRLGGVAGALSQQADKVTAELHAGGTAASVLAVLLKFVTLDGTEPTRRHVYRSALSDAERIVVDAFIAARLLTSDAAGEDAVINVAHEALFRQWPPLRQAIETRADELRQRAELERWAQDWVRSSRRDSYLLRDERLRLAQQWAAANGEVAVELPLVHEFLECSSRSDRSTLERLSEAVARRALTSVEFDPEQGILLAVAAIQQCAPTPLARQALVAALAASRVRRLLRGHNDEVTGVAWSPDGQHLASASRDRTARIWDTASGTEVAVLHGHEDEVTGVAWSPDGQHLATASRDRTVRIWDTASGTELMVLAGHQASVWAAAWSPDGEHLATASDDGTARIWDTASGSELMVLAGHHRAVRDVAWSPDGQHLATASRDRTVRIWDTASGSELMVLCGHQDSVWAAAWSPDGQHLASASRDRTARIWDTASGTELAVLSFKDEVLGVAWSPDGGCLATASHDHTVRIWEIASDTALGVLRGHQDWVFGVAWSPDGRYLASASRDRTARIWEIASGSEVAVLRGHRDALRDVVWSPDGQRLATASHDYTARIWEVASGTELGVLRGHQDWVEGVTWSPDGQRLATASHDYTVRIWEIASGTELGVLRGRQGAFRSVAWSPDGQRLATAANDRTVRIWEVASGSEVAVLRGHQDDVGGVVWSPDGRYLASASRDHTARIWEVASGTEVAVLRGHRDAVRDVAWSPDGQHLATSSHDHTARVWDIASGSELMVLLGHQDWVRDVAWSPNGQRLATASDDGTARIWDTTSGTEVAVLRGHQGWVRGVAWSPDGQRLATASGDRTARIWDTAGVWEPIIDLETLVAEAQDRVFRELTEEERRSVMLPDSVKPI
jgi:WD40 repeat protein